ncbi:hypothetical protein KSP40_PGU004958 [Platanthera guangdongensis]|uniref:Uncharacterized protein n=1 Tax=Platanthera guangdongensis TaxID=2320717 RepID=A0ABR2MH79_9ASPA
MISPPLAGQCSLFRLVASPPQPLSPHLLQTRKSFAQLLVHFLILLSPPSSLLLNRKSSFDAIHRRRHFLHGDNGGGCGKWPVNVSREATSEELISGDEEDTYLLGKKMSGTSVRERRLLRVLEEKRKREFDRIHNYPAWAKFVSLSFLLMPGSKYLSCRCASNTFTAIVTPLLNRLSEESIKALRDARLLLLFRMPTIPQNIPMLYVLLRLYNKDKQAFQLGKYLVKMTVNEVALILGLPNAGLRFKFSRSPVVDKTHKILTEEIHRAADE